MIDKLRGFSYIQYICIYLSRSLIMLVMDKREMKNRIEYIVTVVSCFAEHFKLTTSQAYAYLRRYTGIDFLIDCYEAEHTLSIENAVEDLQIYCYNRGGRLV